MEKTEKTGICPVCKKKNPVVIAEHVLPEDEKKSIFCPMDEIDGDQNFVMDEHKGSAGEQCIGTGTKPKSFSDKSIT
ncbi:hypothetical protein L0Y41_02615 [bacterium]|nr:hypothetical protein [bacterium]